MEFGYDNTSVVPVSTNPLEGRGGSEKAPEKEAGKKPSRVPSKRNQPVSVLVPKDREAKRPKLVVPATTPSAPSVTATTSSRKEKPVAGTLPDTSGKELADPSRPSARKGKNPFPYAEAKLPRDGKVCFVWKEGLAAPYSDSVGLYLPGFSKMKNPAERPASFGEYSREVFRAVEPPFVRQRMKESAEAAISTAIGNILELGSIMGYLKDDLAVRQRKLRVPEVTPTRVAEAVVEREFWQKECATSKKDLAVTKRELEALRKEMVENTRLLEKSAYLLGEEQRKNLELS